MLSSVYDEEEFQRYSARSAVPNHMDFLHSWTRRSALFRRCVNWQSVSYADTPHARFDFFAAADSLHAPTLIFYHGGYWQALHADDFSFLAEAYTQAGINVIIVDYALCPEVSMLTIQKQVSDSFLAIVAASRRLGFDPHRLILAGHSAGGQMITSLICEYWPELGLAANSFTVRLVVSISGLFDLRPLVQTPINRALAMSVATAWHLSPIRRHPSIDVPLLLLVGAEETAGFLDQSDWLVQKWSAELSAIDLLRLHGMHHFSVLDGFSDPTHSLFRKLSTKMLSS